MFSAPRFQVRIFPAASSLKMAYSELWMIAAN